MEYVAGVDCSKRKGVSTWTRRMKIGHVGRYAYVYNRK